LGWAVIQLVYLLGVGLDDNAVGRYPDSFISTDLI
jgi:hypothetical protein